MERSFGNKFGKWIVLAVVVLALGLWFYLSNGEESYLDKYKNYDLSVTSEDLGRSNTYDQYTGNASIPLTLSEAEGTEGVKYYREIGLTSDQTLLTGDALPADRNVTMTEDGASFTRTDNVLEVPAGAVIKLTKSVRYSGMYTLVYDHIALQDATPATAFTVDGEAVSTEFYLSSGEHVFEMTCPDMALLLTGMRLDGPFRSNATTDAAVDLMTVEAAEGVTAAAVAAVTADGAILDEAQMAQAEADGVAFTKVENAVITLSGSSATWKVTVPEAGFYNIELSFLTSKSRGVDLERELLINGELPFDGADTMTFSRLWRDEGTVVLQEDGRKIRMDENGKEIRSYDTQGNQIRPSQTEIFGVEQHIWCRDSLGYITEPYRFYFEAGENTITLNAESEPMVVTAISLKAPVQRQSYEEYLASVPAAKQPQALKDFTCVIEGEDSIRRSSPSLYAKYDRSSPATSPCDVKHTVLNYIGGDAWRDAGQWIEWEFEAPETGWYNITVKGRQTYSRGAVSSRIVYVDGQILFSGMENIGFPYSSTWNMNTLSDANGNAYRFYLEKGTHTIRLEATLGDMGEILSDMEESIYRLNSMYRKILVLTGVTPDQYRDYHLAETYPEVITEMRNEARRLYKLVDDSVAVTGQKSNHIASAQTLAVQLETFAEDDEEITAAFTNFKDNITSMCTSMLNLRQVQLDVDQIIITGDGVKVDKPNENFLAKAWHEIVSCFTSYTVDYNALGDVHTGNDVLEVWILTGRDQSNVLKAMVDDTFTPTTGIKVNVMLVDPNALLNATVAGNGPDVVISTDSWNPVNYALRGAAEDLTQFEGYEEVLANFYPSAYQAFKYIDATGHEGIYALPETQLCSIMFYRKDILADVAEEVGFDIPRTWDQLIAMLPTLQGKNMSVGIPYPDIVNPNLSAFYAMLYQRGGAIYSDDATTTTLNSEAAVAAFEMYTTLYNDYGLPVIFDFVSRFRSGEMPIGIFDYTTFNTLNVSAPEIRGLWDIAILPGTMQEDGTINHAGHSQGACTMMIASDDQAKKQNAWEFMKWWVSTDSQVRFGREIESILGSSARYATANIAAIEQLAWSEDQLAVIREQMSAAIGFREVAGGYYTTRHLTNAIRKVTNEKTDPRETLLDYSRTINEEIVNKRSEFGLPVPQEAIDATRNSTPAE